MPPTTNVGRESDKQESPQSSDDDMVLIGADIGGTFTDVVLIRGREILLEKVLTTPADPSVAVIDGCLRALARMKVLPAQVSVIAHATTIVTNSLIERKGALTGLLTTRGFRDVLEIGNEQRHHIYDLNIDKPQPIVPRILRKGIDERILVDGSIYRPLHTPDVIAAVQELLDLGVQSVAVCLLHSPVNAVHEEQIGALLAERFPNLDVSLSSQVSPEIREFERMSTTVANAYVQPVCKLYLHNLGEGFHARGIRSPFHVMASSGGIVSAEMAMEYPVRIMESGPAAGVMAALYCSQSLGSRNLIAFDMGGTTAKICLITDGAPRRARQFEAARVNRFQRGSGLPIKIPVIELIDIGAGGGSIARADDMGLLKVGPDSAGAQPGPACYGQGGTDATVTDADLILGYLDPDYFVGGTMHLDLAAAKAALKKLGTQLGLSLVEASRGIYQVVNENMAIATRVQAAEQGEDPRRYDLVAFGGAGPVHAYDIARNLKLKRVICPAGAGTLSALGLLVAPRAVEFAQGYPMLLENIDWMRLRRIISEMEQKAITILLQTGVAAGQINYDLYADMRYRGQGFEIEVPVERSVLESGDVSALVVGFETIYPRLFGRTVPNNTIEVLTWRLRADAPPLVTKVDHSVATSDGDPLKGRRPVFFVERGAYVETRVLDRYRLFPGHRFAGPCVIEERESTVVVGPSGNVAVDEHLNLILSIEG